MWGTRCHPQILNVQLALASAMQQLHHVRHRFRGGDCHVRTPRICAAKVRNQSVAHTNIGDEEHVCPSNSSLQAGKRRCDTLPEMSNSYFCGPINTSESPESSSLTSQRGALP